jgi:hypothetical protein
MVRHSSLLIPSTQAECHAIVTELCSLVAASELTASSDKRLFFLLQSYFQDDSAGSAFRSMTSFASKHAHVSFDDFNSHVIGPSTHCCYISRPDPSMSHLFRLVAVDCRAEQEKNKLDLAHSSVDFVLAHLVKCHPQFTLTERFVLKIPKQWKNCILGKLDRSSLRTFYVPNLDELKHRITKSLDCGLERKRTTGSSHLFCADTGEAWQNPKGNDDFDINAFHLKSCSQFPDYLRNLLQETGTALDKLAGVEPSSRQPEIEQAVRDACAAAQTRGVESHDMFLEDGTTLGASILALHNGCLSAEWVASHLVDTDNNSFMQDYRAEALHGTERLLRVCSNYHAVETPTWFQIGKHNSACSYLSQSASAAETGWLRIASYLIKLEIDCINFQLSKISGTKKHWLDPEEHVTDASVIALGHPSDSSFKLHTDL